MNHPANVRKPICLAGPVLAAVHTAQAEYDKHQPDVIVGSSPGGAIAMNINVEKTPLVLLCPAWKNWGTVKAVESDGQLTLAIVTDRKSARGRTYAGVY